MILMTVRFYLKVTSVDGKGPRHSIPDTSTVSCLVGLKFLFQSVVAQRVFGLDRPGERPLPALHGTGRRRGSLL